MPGRELPGLAKDRQGCRDAVEGEEGLDRIGVDRAARKRPQLGRERELAVYLPVVERLDPVAVSGEDEPALRPVPERDGKHAAQALRKIEPVLLVEVDEHLGVAMSREGVPGPLEVMPELAVVVELAVLDDLDAAVLVADRLVTGLEVDDRETPRGEADAAVDE